ncbi:MAG: DsbA family protein [bacterium]|nr:DsbA family protein [bacterium]
MHTDSSRKLASFTALVAPATWALLATFAVCVTTGCGALGLDSKGQPTAAASTAAPGPSTEGGDRVALVLDGREITVDELHAHMQKQFLDELLRQPESELFELRENAARDLVQRHVIDAAAAEEGLSPEALLEKVTSTVPETTVEQVTAWYTENQSRLRGARLEDVAPQIKDMLDNEAKARAWGEYIGPRLEALEWRFALTPPRVDLEATRLVRGPAEAPVTIMTFSDYQCPYCIRSEPVLAEVLERYPEDVRLVHRHFPLDSIHPQARPAAEAAMCADEQGRFWDYHDAIFARSGRLEADSFAEIGRELDLDLDALGQCMGERRYQAFVQTDFEAGEAAGVTGTPAFFVNGIALKGARDADEISRVIDSELARIRAN